MDREPPKPGECWRHYKLKDGAEYIANIVAIAQYHFTNQEDAVIYGDLIEIINELAVYSNFVVKDAETGDLIEVHKRRGQWKLLPALNTALRKPVGWARSLGNFMGIVSFPCGNKASNCYRFERIK